MHKCEVVIRNSRTVRRIVRRIAGFALVGLTLPLVVGSAATAASSAKAPPDILRAKVFATSSSPNPKPIEFDSLITSIELGQNDADITSRSIAGNVEWALGTFNGFQYPIVSLDQGRRWRIGGAYFGAPWADACAFVSHLRAVSKNVVVGWGGCPGTLYVTWDSGRHWNGVPLPGSLESVRFTRENERVTWINASVSPFSSTKEHPAVVHYTSTNSGRTWTLRSIK